MNVHAAIASGLTLGHARLTTTAPLAACGTFPPGGSFEFDDECDVDQVEAVYTADARVSLKRLYPAM